MEAINRCFDKSSVEDILAALERENTDWARKQLEVSDICTPISSTHDTNVFILFHRLYQRW